MIKQGMFVQRGIGLSCAPTNFLQLFAPTWFFFFFPLYFPMASRALFNHQLTRTLKRPGVRLNTTFNSKFAQERNAVKEHAGSM